MEDQASSRTASRCRSATRLPSVIDAADSTAIAGPQVAPYAGNATTTISSSPATPPALDTVARYAATGTGAPWYTSGAHQWNGTRVILKPKPVSTRTTAAVTSGRVRTSARAASAAAIRSRWTVPVNPYTSAMPSSITALAVTETSRNFTAASAERLFRRRNPTRTYVGSVSVSSPTTRVTRSRAPTRVSTPTNEASTSSVYSPAGCGDSSGSRVATTPAEATTVAAAAATPTHSTADRRRSGSAMSATSTATIPVAAARMGAMAA